jgi:hypothetical protein
LLEDRDVSQVQTEVCWEGVVSPRPLINFWDLLQSILQAKEKKKKVKIKWPQLVGDKDIHRKHTQ